MKAAQINGYGGKDILQTVSDATRPAIKSGQVLVEVYAAGANPFDWKVREGYYKDFIKLNFPATLGGDVAGVVAEIGEDVSGFTVGQPVYGSAGAVSGQGSYAEYAPVSAKQLVDKPKSVDYVSAAALPLAGVSAYQALVDHIGLQRGQKILIHGGAGGIGSLAIQLAKHLGAYIAATAAGKDADFVRSIGADEVSDYQEQDFSQLIKDYDAVFDTVGGETNAKSYQVLKPGGSLVSMVEEPDEALAKQHGVMAIHQTSKATTERLTRLAELVDSGVIKVNVDKVFALDKAPAALEYLKTGHPRGKVVIQVKP